MDIGRFADSGITIALGIALLLTRACGRGRFRVFPLLVIGYGVSMIAVHSLSPRATAPKPAAPAWHTVTSTDGVLSLSMPGKPQVQTHDTESELGPVRSVKHSLSTENGNFVFTINEIHYVNEELQFDPKEAVALMVQDTVSKSQGTLVREREIRLGSHEGKEVGIRAKGYLALMRLIFMGRCAYQVKIVVPETEIESPIVSRYFDSLSVKESRPPG